MEGYHCSYGLNPRHANLLRSGALRATAWDDAGDVRAVELTTHPFFVATLFQPERAALAGRVPPVVRGFVEAARSTSHPTEPSATTPTFQRNADACSREQQH